MHITPIRPYMSQNISLKSNKQTYGTSEVLHDTFEAAGAVGMFLLLDYFTELKNNTKRVKAGKILLMGSFIAGAIYEIAERLKKGRK